MNDLERRRAADARHHENRARLAHAWARFETEGVGSAQFEDEIEFGLTFLDRPYVSTGASVDLDALAETLALDEEDLEIPLPTVSAYVVEWSRDERGFYTGCWCAAVVTLPGATLPEGGQLIIEHNFTFSGVALKDVPVDLTT